MKEKEKEIAAARVPSSDIQVYTVQSLYRESELGLIQARPPPCHGADAHLQLPSERHARRSLVYGPTH